jgi:hypothetical protein
MPLNGSSNFRRNIVSKSTPTYIKGGRIAFQHTAINLKRLTSLGTNDTPMATATFQHILLHWGIRSGKGL